MRLYTRTTTRTICAVVVSLMMAVTFTSTARADDEPRWLYRVDTRDPEEIFESGFAPRGTDPDLLSHVSAAGGSDAAARSGLVATTSDLAVAERLASLYLDEAVSNGDEEPTVYLYSIAPTHHFYDVHRSLLVHADQAEALPATPEYVLSVRSIAISITATEHEWVSDRLVPPSYIADAQVWTRDPDHNDAQTDEVENEAFERPAGGVSGGPYVWDVPRSAVLAPEISALNLPISDADYRLVSPSLFAFFAECDLMRSDICDTASVGRQMVFTRVESGLYLSSTSHVPATHHYCRATPRGLPLSCEKPYRRTVSSDGWQRQDAGFTLHRSAGSDTLHVTYAGRAQQYFWGGRWYGNKYDTTVHLSIQVETLDGEVFDRKFGFVSTQRGDSFSLPGARITPPDAGYLVRVEAVTSGMWWSNHESSTIVDDMVFYVG